MSTFEYIIVENKGAVGIITLNRPKMLNALSFGVFREIARAVDALESDEQADAELRLGTFPLPMSSAAAALAEVAATAPPADLRASVCRGPATSL